MNIKTLKIILINLCLVIVVFHISDYLLFNYYYNRAANTNYYKQNIKEYFESYKIKDFDTIYYNHLKNDNTETFRDYKKESSKRPILILGCSFAHGYMLQPEQSFSYKLSDMTGRSVYNRAISGLGIQYFPYIIDKFNIEKEIKDPEYIIFVMIENHVSRLYRHVFGLLQPVKDIRYRTNSKQHLELINPQWTFFYRYTIIRYLLGIYSDYKENKIFDNDNFEFIKLHFSYAQQLVKAHFPNSKIIILKYEDMPNSWILNTQRWKELEQAGFLITDTYNLTGQHMYDKQYKIPNDFHPNEQAWNIIVPELVKEYNL